MADFKQIPTPTYEYEIQQLVNYYRKAVREVSKELEKIDLTDFQRAQALAVQRNIAGILEELDENASEWVEENIPKAAEGGVVRAIISLGVAETVEEAQKIISFNRLNKNLVETAVADTQDDLLQISKNVSRKVRNTIRQVTAEVLRSNLTQGINGKKALTSEILKELRKQLGDAVDTGIIDASSRKWDPKVYSEMVVRTKMAHTHREATQNEAVSRGALYGVISTHFAKDACRNWEGKIVKLSRDAEGDYPYIGDLPRREIFHPNCRHQVSPIRRLDRLED